MIRTEDKDFWQAQADKRAADYPHVGRMVTIVDGRKHKGKTGKVLAHKRDAYSDAFRYGNDASHTLRDMAGREGFVVLVDTGLEKFWVKASYCLCEGRKHTPEQNYRRFCVSCQLVSNERGRNLTQEEESELWKEIHT